MIPRSIILHSPRRVFICCLWLRLAGLLDVVQFVYSSYRSGRKAQCKPLSSCANYLGSIIIGNFAREVAHGVAFFVACKAKATLAISHHLVNRRKGSCAVVKSHIPTRCIYLSLSNWICESLLQCDRCAVICSKSD